MTSRVAKDHQEINMDYDMTKKRIQNGPPSQTDVGIKEAMMLHRRNKLKRKTTRNLLHLFMTKIKLM